MFNYCLIVFPDCTFLVVSKGFLRSSSLVLFVFLLLLGTGWVVVRVLTFPLFLIQSKESSIQPWLPGCFKDGEVRFGVGVVFALFVVVVVLFPGFFIQSKESSIQPVFPGCLRGLVVLLLVDVGWVLFCFLTGCAIAVAEKRETRTAERIFLFMVGRFIN